MKASKKFIVTGNLLSYSVGYVLSEEVILNPICPNSDILKSVTTVTLFELVHSDKISCPVKSSTIIGSTLCKGCEYCLKWNENLIFCSHKGCRFLTQKKDNNETVIYLAGELFTEAQRDFNLKVKALLMKNKNIKVVLPQEFCEKAKTAKSVFNECVKQLKKADAVLSILENPDTDSGTSWELGYAYCAGIPSFGIRTDFRQHGDDDGLNCMLSQSLNDLYIGNSFNQETCIKLTDQINEAVRIKKVINV